jgi:hypothetical protein
VCHVGYGRRAAGQSENPLRRKTYNYFAGELMEQGQLAQENQEQIKPRTTQNNHDGHVERDIVNITPLASIQTPTYSAAAIIIFLSCVVRRPLGLTREKRSTHLK